MRPKRTLLWIGVVCSGVALAGAGADVQIRDINGQWLSPFKPAGLASVLFFVSTDCPVSNSYAPEIQRICNEYEPRGVGCSLMYEDVDLDGTPPGSRLTERVRTHLDEYQYRGVHAAIDSERTIAHRVKATVTPQAVVVDREGNIRYSGRINNFYAALGKSRRQVTVNDLRDALDAVLAGRPVSTPKTEALGCYIVDPKSLRK